MTKTKLILAITTGLALTLLTIGYFLPRSKNRPVSHAALKLVLEQTPDYKLIYKDLSLENSYSSDYKLEIPYGYYNFKILGGRGEVLFFGKVAKNRVHFPPYEINSQNEELSTELTVAPLSDITLFLPYFTQAKKVVFFDENNVEKYQVELNEVTLPKDYTKKLCGNGICDFNENIIFCYKDCQPR